MHTSLPLRKFFLGRGRLVCIRESPRPGAYARRFSREVTKVRPIVRKRILERHGSICAHCGTTEKLEIDHIIPLSKGGREDEDNMQVLCRKCNREKSNKFNYMGYFRVDVSPEFMEVGRDIEPLFKAMSAEEWLNLTKSMMKVHENYWCGKGQE